MKKSGVFYELIRIFQLVRIKTSIIAFIITGGISVYNYHYTINALILGLTVLSTISFGYSINEYCDHKKDILMPGDHLIPSGLMTRKQVLIISCCFFSVSLLLTTLLSSFQQVLNIILLFILSVYSYINNKNGIIANILVATCSGLGILLTLRNFEWSITSYTCIAFFLHILGREIILDIHDYEADRAMGKNSFPILFTIHRSFLIAILLSMGCIIYAAIVGFYFMRYSYVLFIFLGNAVFLFGVLNYWSSTAENEYKKFVLYSRISFLLVIPAFFF
ncbi:MAG: UbiA family prenyltransferase [Ferruginibacter sp.]